ncbi:CAP domain-containing protein [Butyricicoccus sp. 1XD8-22]|nr:CAP domain-containing protein [Butyricicoccus sp. 1XD8-22]
MKKTIVMGLAAAMLLSVNAGAVNRPDSQQIVQNGRVYIVSGSNLKDILSDLNDRFGKFDWSQLPSLPTRPGTPGKPGTPDKPDTPDVPDTPDTPDKPVTPPASDTSLSAYAQEVVRLVNAERAKYGLSALTVNAKASQAAQVRAAEQARSFSHTRPNGSSCFTALKEAGVSYRSAGENIAYGQRTPQQVVTAWMNSSGHRANILGSQFTQIGVGYTLIGGTPYWAQFFIG